MTERAVLSRAFIVESLFMFSKFVKALDKLYKQKTVITTSTKTTKVFPSKRTPMTADFQVIKDYFSPVENVDPVQ